MPLLSGSTLDMDDILLAKKHGFLNWCKTTTHSADGPRQSKVWKLDFALRKKSSFPKAGRQSCLLG